MLPQPPFVHLDTLWEAEEYVIFAVLRVSLDVRDEDGQVIVCCRLRGGETRTQMREW